MTVRTTIFGVTLLLSCSCFLQQTKPHNDNPVVKDHIQGTIALEDISGAEKSANFNARFQKDEEKQQALVRLSGLRSLLESQDVRSAKPACKLSSFSIKGSTVRNVMSASSDYISVGKVSFGPALQSSLVEVERQKDNQYARDLEPGFPPNQYLVVVEGTENAPAFQVYLSLPEELREVKANGSSFEGSQIEIKKDTPLALVWEAPIVENAENVIVIDILVTEETAGKLLRCAAYESSFKRDRAQIQGEISAEMLSGLPESEASLIYFSRAHLRDIDDKELSLQLQGLRTHLGGVKISAH